MLHNIALPAEVIGGCSNVVIGISAGPDTETVVVFGHEDDFGESGFLEETYPLVGVYLSVGGVEGGCRAFRIVTPFDTVGIGKGIHPEMDKPGQRILQVFHLPGIRCRAIESRLCKKCTDRKNKEKKERKRFIHFILLSCKRGYSINKHSCNADKMGIIH